VDTGYESRRGPVGSSVVHWVTVGPGGSSVVQCGSKVVQCGPNVSSVGPWWPSRCCHVWSMVGHGQIWWQFVL